jgi:D-sedoheptulose 7-phosphate isomerase
MSLKQPNGQALLDGMREHVRRTEEVIRSVEYAAVAQLTEKLHQAYQAGNRVFLFGNGGSAACASHFAEDLGKGIVRDLEHQKRLRVLSLADSAPYITALGNDCGYDSIFRQQLQTNAAPGDVAIGISGSGNSPNVLNAVAWAKENGLFTAGITGFDGGKLRKMVDLSIHFPVMDMEIAENAHLIVLHLVVGGLRRLINE